MVTSTVISAVPPWVLYRWDGIKRTRKGAYTDFLTYVSKDYGKLSRKLKKAKKRSVRLSFYYDKGRVCIFNPKMLSTPTPWLIFNLFKTPEPTSWTQSTPMRFQRYKEKVAQCT